MENENRISLVEFSHHDLGWHKFGYREEADFVNYEINKALDLMQKDDEYKFCWTHEHGEYLHQYLLDNGERYEELKNRILEGRFEIGSGYSSPYTSFVTAETLVRQMIYGKKWVEDTFEGYCSNVFYNTDVPGMTQQLPQILKKSGVEYLYLSRSWAFDNFKNNEFLTWYSPDKTGIKTHFMHHYGDNIWEERNIKFVEKRVPEYNYKNPMLLLAMDCTPPMDLQGLLKDWNKYTLFTENKMKFLPNLDYKTYQHSISEIWNNNEFLQELKGEWPNKWLYEVAASDYNCFLNQREAERNLRFAEMLGVISSIAKGSFKDYESGKLEKGWRYAAHACHGFAPEKPIAEFRRRYKMANEMARDIIEKEVSCIANGITKKSDGIPLVVFQQDAYTREDVVTVKLPNGIKNAIVKNAEGKILPSQIKENGNIDIQLTVPAAGFTTVYLTEIDKVETAKLENNACYENEFFSLKLGENGFESVYDKQYDKELFENGKFIAGEMLEMNYMGMGAGEHLNLWQPDSVNYRHIFKDSPLTWSCIEKGDVKTVFEAKTKTDFATIILQVTAYEKIKMLSYDVSLTDLTLPEKKQLRLMFPMHKGKVSYEVPFAEVKVGTDEVLKKFAWFNPNNGNFNNDRHFDNSAVRPREVQNYIGCTYDSNETMISSYNVPWDYQDPTQNPLEAPVLQPILISTSKACHWKYGYWLQTDNRKYHFSIFSGNEHEDLCRKATSSNNPFIGMFSKANASLFDTDCYSLISLENPNIAITALKKAEDESDAYVVRLFNRSENTLSDKAEFGSAIKTAEKVNLLERTVGENVKVENADTLTVCLNEAEIQTYKIKPNGVETTVQPPKKLLPVIDKKSHKITLNWQGNSKEYTVYFRKTDIETEWSKIASTNNKSATFTLEDGAFDLCVAGNDTLPSCYIEIIVREAPVIELA